MPEERLLDVINADKNNIEAGREQIAGKSTFSLTNFFKIFRFKKFKSETKESTFIAESHQRNIPFLIKALKVVVVVLFFVVFFDIFSNYKYGVPKFLPKRSTAKPAMLKTQEIRYLKPAEYYLDRVKERDVFVKYVEEAPQENEPHAEEEVEPEETSQLIKEKTKNFVLVGIAWGENIETMIEDITEGKAYFLKEGDVIGKTEVFIKKIYKDRVILGYQNEELEFIQ